VTKELQKKQPTESVVDLAVSAVEDSDRPVDLPVGDVDPSPTALGLPQGERRESCSRCSRPAVDACSEGGSSLCEECAQ